MIPDDSLRAMRAAGTTDEAGRDQRARPVGRSSAEPSRNAWARGTGDDRGFSRSAQQLASHPSNAFVASASGGLRCTITGYRSPLGVGLSRPRGSFGSLSAASLRAAARPPAPTCWGPRSLRPGPVGARWRLDAGRRSFVAGVRLKRPAAPAAAVPVPAAARAEATAAAAETGAEAGPLTVPELLEAKRAEFGRVVALLNEPRGVPEEERPALLRGAQAYLLVSLHQLDALASAPGLRANHAWQARIAGLESFLGEQLAAVRAMREAAEQEAERLIEMAEFEDEEYEDGQALAGLVAVHEALLAPLAEDPRDEALDRHLAGLLLPDTRRFWRREASLPAVELAPAEEPSLHPEHAEAGAGGLLASGLPAALVPAAIGFAGICLATAALVRRGPAAALQVAGHTGLLLLAGLAGYGSVVVQHAHSWSLLREARRTALAALAGRQPAADFRAAVEKVRRAVVMVSVPSGQGTGFLLDRQRGLVCTNHHVVSDHRDEVSERAAVVAAGRRLDAVVLGTDPAADVALLRVDPAALPAGVEEVEAAGASELRAGDLVFAVGHPQLLSDSVFAGVASGFRRGYELRQPHRAVCVQSDTLALDGSSGGPLADARGRVVGLLVMNVHSSLEPSSTGSFSFALCMDEVRRVAAFLAKGLESPRPHLGAYVTSTAVSEVVRSAPAQVWSLEEGSPAARAGLRRGDLIEAVDGAPVRCPADAFDALLGRRPGDAVRLRVRRGGAEEELDVELGRVERSVPAGTTGRAHFFLV